MRKVKRTPVATPESIESYSVKMTDLVAVANNMQCGEKLELWHYSVGAAVMVHDAIAGFLAKGLPIVVSLHGCPCVSMLFLQTAIGQLYNGTINTDLLSFDALAHAGLLDQVVADAKQYFARK